MSADVDPETQGIYDQLVFFEHSASDNDIVKDICRTFPHHVFYSQRHGGEDTAAPTLRVLQ